MSHDSLNDFTYYEGLYSFRNETVEVLMDEATFDKYMEAYLVRHGIETRTNKVLFVMCKNTLGAIHVHEEQRKEE
jgi:hypothetical protein